MPAYLRCYVNLLAVKVIWSKRRIKLNTKNKPNPLPAFNYGSSISKQNPKFYNVILFPVVSLFLACFIIYRLLITYVQKIQNIPLVFFNEISTTQK